MINEQLKKLSLWLKFLSMQMLNKKILCFFFLGIMLFPEMLSLYLQGSQIILHYEMREELEKANLSTIIIPSSQLYWTRKGKEAIIQGNLFDVKSYEVNGDEVYLTGIFDKEEDLLAARISAIPQQNNHGNSNTSSIIFEWLSCFSLCAKTTDAGASCLVMLQQYFFSAKINFQSIKMPVDPPPPRPQILYTT